MLLIGVEWWRPLVAAALNRSSSSYCHLSFSPRSARESKSKTKHFSIYPASKWIPNTDLYSKATGSASKSPDLCSVLLMLALKGCKWDKSYWKDILVFDMDADDNKWEWLNENFPLLALQSWCTWVDLNNLLFIPPRSRPLVWRAQSFV